MNRSVDQGLIGRVCPQARPAWQPIAAQFAPAYLAGQPFNSSAAEASIVAAAGAPRSADERTTEDCLFLDVVVPERVFSRGSSSSRPGKGAPVLVWIYGGGYTFSDKTGDGAERFFNPAGLIQASQNNGSEGVVYVAFNYRVGILLQILLGPGLQEGLNMVSLGLSDGLPARRSSLKALPTLDFMISDWHCNGCKDTSISLVVILTESVSAF